MRSGITNDRALPVRKLSRLSNEMYLTSTMALRAFVPDSYARGVIALLLLKQCLADWCGDDGPAVPRAITRTASINALATSLKSPYATVHRHIRGLIDDGLCVDTGAGYAIATDARAAELVLDLLTTAHDSLIRLAQDGVADWGLIDRAPGRPAGPRCATIAAALDIWLVPFEANNRPVADWLSRVILIAVAVANVRHVTEDPVLSERFAYDPTPDAMRRPIQTRAIGRTLGFAYGTVFRHCQALRALDVIAPIDGGWVIASRMLFDDAIDAGIKAQLSYFRRRLAALIAVGLDPARLGDAYLAGRPPLVPLSLTAQG